VAAPTAAKNVSGSNSATRPLRPSKKRLPFPLNLYQTAIGKKWVMAVTGIMLLGFVLFHMFGNMKLYLGVIEHNGERLYDVDIYGEFLRELLVPLFPRTWFLWLLRGGLIAAFILHIHAAYTLTEWERGEIQANVVHSLSNPAVAIFYIIANVLLCVHIYHGVYSMFQSLGINNPRYNSLRRSLASGLALVILIGNVSFPIAVLAGVIDYDPSLLGPAS